MWTKQPWKEFEGKKIIVSKTSKAAQRTPVPLKSPAMSAISESVSMTYIMKDAFSSPEFSSLFEGTVEKCLNKHLTPLATTVNEQTNKIGELEEKVNDLSKQLHEVKIHVDDQEQYNRRNGLKLWVSTSETPDENTDEIVIETAKTIGVNIDSSEICRSHRVGRPKNQDKQKPILVKFTSYRCMEKLYNVRKKTKKGSYISEDLARHRESLFYKTRQEQKGGTFTHAWTKDGRVLGRLASGRVMNIQHESDLVNITDTINNDQRQQTLRARNMNNEPAPEPLTATAEGQGSNSI